LAGNPDLAAELAAKASYGDPVYSNPSGKLKAVETNISSRGWNLSFSRTAKARSVLFERSKT
jgi:hypothetical protein